MYKAAHLSLSRKDEYNVQSTEEVGAHTQSVSERPHIMKILKTGAKENSIKEFMEEVGLSKRSWEAVPIEDVKRARQVIKERYLTINQDPTQNRAILDPILFPNG